MTSRHLFLGAGFLMLLALEPVAKPVVAGQTATARGATGNTHHRLVVTLDPVGRRLSVIDELLLPPADTGEREFVLNGSLRITTSEPAVREVPLGTVAGFSGINSSPAGNGVRPPKRYRVTVPAAGGTLRLQYEGAFDFGLSAAEEEYTRGFRSTQGIVSPEGVYLAGDSYWYPHLNEDLVEFEMTVRQPSNWYAISEGNGTARGNDGLARWESHGLTDEIHIVGGPLHLTMQRAGNVDTQVYLRKPDPGLSSKYLSATAQYLEMYRTLIGPYPYGKFALVENFWETGYGMPSFTLLGSQIIRFPFIITSSYPHEILHNWWGNSVFVDYDTGNWCEGLTAYMADHMIQEQHETAGDYRRATLQKYRDYVREGRDFPLTEFRSRHSAATEAVGYGRTLMGFHMLRQQVGDEAFRKWAAEFYRLYRGKRASFGDVQRTFEVVTGQKLDRFFTDWVRRTGAATLAVSLDPVMRAQSKSVVTGTIRQVQSEAAYELNVPVVVQTSGRPVLSSVHMTGKEARFEIATADEPLAVHVDPSFDVFRRLDPRETPPSIGQIFGESKVLAVVPASASARAAAAYRALIESWRSPSHAPEIVTDKELSALPSDRPVWILGRENLFAQQIIDGAAVQTTDAGFRIDGEPLPFATHTAVIVRRHPSNPEKAVGLIAVDPLEAMPGLGRKLPHYGKYSYLGFEGDEPVNTLKGEWKESDSPLRVDVRPATARSTSLPGLTLPKRTALASLPPTFSAEALAGHAQRLSSDEFEGRGIGTQGLERAAAYVADQFKAAGLAPGGDAGTYMQSFSTSHTPDGQTRTIANVIGVLAGRDPAWASQAVVVSAHYDHLGKGWPDPRRGDEGRVHPGADDNASGVAVLIELAKAFAAEGAPRRTILFIAFTGEDAGLLGSKYYADHPRTPLHEVMGVINLDTVGRLFSGTLGILGTGTAAEWQHIFNGASYVTGVPSRNIPESLPSSDQASFVAKGVPAVQIFTPTHADYHRPTDTFDKLDLAGLVKVATFTREGVAYLAEREQPMIRPGPVGSAASSATPSSESRRVSLGTVPDFAFAGPGVRVSDVVKGSPAEAAGLRAGDVLLELAGKGVASLQGYSDLLKTLTPNQRVEVLVERGGQRLTLWAVLAER
ncbi:MAG: M20/M25/M40 family metallo-hydrolase [Vicinamibacterales bacterium]